MADIDIGPPAIDRANDTGWNNTLLNLDNPANATGTIKTVKIWAEAGSDLVGCKVGTFFGTAPDYTSRGVATIGAVTGGSEQTFGGLAIDVVTGDLIGSYHSGGDFERDTAGFLGVYGMANDQFGTGLQTYTLYADNTYSLYGEGDLPPVGGAEGKTAHMAAKMIAGRLI